MKREGRYERRLREDREEERRAQEARKRQEKVVKVQGDATYNIERDVTLQSESSLRATKTQNVML